MNIEIPSQCPCCGYALSLVNDQLFCRNAACPAQLNKKLEHFCKVLGIKGFGPKTIEKIELSDLTELFYLDQEQVAAALGSEKTAAKLLDEIERAKGVPLNTVLAAFSIPLIGETASNKICAVVASVSEITQETCKEAGLGEKATANLLNWLETEFVEMKAFLPFTFKSASTSKTTSTGPTVCITGKLKSYKTKAEAYKALTDAGYTVVESVTKNLNYLVDEEDKNSSKRTKAESYGIRIINNLPNFLKENTNDE